MNRRKSPTNGRVTVVIPTYNRADRVARAIQNALNQTAADRCDVVVVDDGSTDDTPAVAAGFGDRIRYIRQPNRGAAAARNAGIRASDGEFVAFLDSDDEWTPDKTERQLEALQRWPEAVLAAGRSVARYADGRTRAHLTPSIPFDRPVDFAPLLFDKNFMPTPTVMVRRSALEQTGLFREQLLRRHDYHLWVRLSCRGPGVYLDAIVAHYDDDAPDGLSRDRDICMGYKLRACRLLEPELRRRPDCAGIWRRGMADTLASMRDHAYQDGRFKAAAWHGIRSFWYAPRRPKWEWGRLAASLWRASWPGRATSDRQIGHTRGMS
jgi:glycosyltransferase involved in cell wall biosynthesis